MAGRTGNSTGVHLHFEVRRYNGTGNPTWLDSDPIDPYDKRLRADGWDCANSTQGTAYPNPANGIAGKMGENHLWIDDPPRYSIFNPPTHFDLSNQGAGGWSPGYDTKVVNNIPWTVEVKESSQYGQQPNPGVLSPEFIDLNPGQFTKCEIGVKELMAVYSPGYIYYILDNGSWDNPNRINLGSGITYGNDYKKYEPEFNFSGNIKQFSIELTDVGVVGDQWIFDYITFYSSYRHWDFIGTPLGWTGRNATYSLLKSGGFFVGFDAETPDIPTDWSGIISPKLFNLTGGVSKYLVFNFSIKNKDINISDVKARFLIDGIWEASGVDVVKVDGSIGINKLASFYRAFPISGILEQIRIDLLRDGDTGDSEDILQITYIDLVEIATGLMVDVIDDGSEKIYVFNDEGEWEEFTTTNYVYHLPLEVFDNYEVHIAGTGGDVYAPENLRTTSVTETTVDLAWDASLTQYAGYKVYRDGIKIGETIELHYSDSGLSPNTTYSYYVKATLNGENSDLSNIINVNTLSENLLFISPEFFDFGTLETNATFNVINESSSPANWQIMSFPAWFFGVNPTSGTINAGSNAFVCVSANRSGLSLGTHYSVISFTSNVGAKDVAVSIIKEDQPDGYPIRIEAEIFINGILTSQGRSFGPSDPEIYRGISLSEDGWVEVEVVARNIGGQPASIYTELSPQYIPQDIASGSFQSYVSKHRIFAGPTDLKIRLTESSQSLPNAAVEVDYVIVRYVAQPQCELSRNVLNFTSSKLVNEFTVTNTDINLMDWTINELVDQTWITSISPSSGILEFEESTQIAVSIDTTGLEDGDYKGYLKCTYNTTEIIYITVKLSKLTLPDGEVLLFSDDFSSDFSNWETGGAGDAFINNGQLCLTSNGGNTYARIIAPDVQDLNNVTVSLYIDNGPEERKGNGTSVYILCDQDRENYFSLDVAEDNVYDGERQAISLHRKAAGQVEILASLERALLSPGYYRLSVIGNDFRFTTGAGDEILTAPAYTPYISGGVQLSVNEETTYFDDIEVYTNYNHVNPDPFLNISTTVLDFGRDDTELTFDINSNTDWEITSSNELFSCDLASGLGDGVITVTFDRTSAPQGTSNGIITLSYSGCSKTVSVNGEIPFGQEVVVRFYSLPGDGYVEYEANNCNDWNTVHDASAGHRAKYSGADIYDFNVGCWNQDGLDFIIDRMFLPFDTAELPDDPYIVSATMGLYCHSGVMGSGALDYFTVVQTSQSSSTSLSIDEYDLCGSVHNAVKGSNDLPISGVSTNGYNIWQLNATGMSWINDAGITKLGLREGYDIQDQPIATNTNRMINCRSSEYEGTQCDPYLEVTYIEEEPIPVKLTLFSASFESNRINITWQTASEINLAGFYLLRSIHQDSVFRKINTTLIPAKSEKRTKDEYYEYVDYPDKVQVYIYKLELVRLDGSSFVSEEIETQLPDFITEKLSVADFALFQNYPNPYNPSTTISFNLQKPTQTKLSIFNISGNIVATLVDEYKAAGYYAVVWNSVDENGITLPSGIYFYKLDTFEFSAVKRLLLMK